MNRIAILRLTLASAAAGVLLPAPITVTPASHDFGEYTVGAETRPVEFRWVAPVGRPIAVEITDSANFHLGDYAGPPEPWQLVRNLPITRCTGSGSATVCTTVVAFRPQRVGPLAATLLISDGTRNPGTAQLRGKGVAPACRPRVVPCNYSHFYSGVFSWSVTLDGPGSHYGEDVSVTLATDGQATCSGSVTETEQGRTRSAVISGPGLIAVEFAFGRN